MSKTLHKQGTLHVYYINITCTLLYTSYSYNILHHHETGNCCGKNILCRCLSHNFFSTHRINQKQENQSPSSLFSAKQTVRVSDTREWIMYLNWVRNTYGTRRMLCSGFFSSLHQTETKLPHRLSGGPDSQIGLWVTNAWKQNVHVISVSLSLPFSLSLSLSLFSCPSPPCLSFLCLT